MRGLLSTLVLLFVVASPAHAASAFVGTGSPNGNSVDDIEAVLETTTLTDDAIDDLIDGLIVAHEVNGCNSTTCTGQDDKDLSGDSFTITLTSTTEGSFDFSLPDGYELVFYTVKASNNFAVYKMDTPAPSGMDITFDTLKLPKGNSGSFGPDLSNMFFFVRESDPVPLPAAALLFPAGLGLISWRRRQSK